MTNINCNKLFLVLSLLTWEAAFPQGLQKNAALEMDGIGPIKVGMSLAEASRASKLLVKLQEKGESECEIAGPVGGPDGLGFVLVEGRIALIQTQSASIATDKGVRNGDTEQRVLDAYKGIVHASPKPKESDQARIFKIRSKSKSSEDLELTFYLWGGKVGLITAGRPIVDKIGESCRYKSGGSSASVSDGSWGGLTNDNYPVEIVFQGGVGKFGYPTLRCGGDLVFIKSESNGFIFKERMTAGKNLCADGGIIKLSHDSANDPSHMKWQYEGSGRIINANLASVGIAESGRADVTSQGNVENKKTKASSSKQLMNQTATVPANQSFPADAETAPAQVAPANPPSASKASPLPSVTDCSKVSGFIAQAQCIANMAAKVGIGK